MTGISLNFNSAASVARSAFGRATDAVDRSMERLATGKKINRASDDPAGLVAAEDFRATLYRIEKSITGLERTNLSLAAREGHLSVINEMAAELVGVVTAAANRDALGEGELEALQIQAAGVIDGIQFLAQTSRFQGQQTIAGVGSGLDVLRAGGEFNLVDGDLEGAQEFVEGFLDGIVGTRAGIGRQMQENESRLRVLQDEYIHTTDALSGIEDADYASEASALVRGQVLQQVAIKTQQIAQQQAAAALQLLQGAQLTKTL